LDGIIEVNDNLPGRDKKKKVVGKTPATFFVPYLMKKSAWIYTMKKPPGLLLRAL
jgi:hypothetical protein